MRPGNGPTLPVGDGMVRQVGLFAGNGSARDAGPVEASFDFFEIKTLETRPQTSPSYRPSDGVDKPDIVFILADDLGYGDVHCLNPEHGGIPTPNLDRLAAQGMVFTEAHGSAAVCTPSRYGLLTGRYNWRSRLQQGVLDNGEKSTALIAPDRLTLPKLLQQQGYRTAGFGKWHLGLTAPIRDGRFQVAEPLRDGPVTRGFDYFFGNDFRFFAPFLFIENDRFVGEPLLEETRPGFKFGTGTSLTPDDFAHILPTVTDKAIAKLRALAEDGRPFFVYFAPCAPHDPFVPTAAWKGRSGLGLYADYVMETDAEIGRLLAAFDQTGQADKTLVMFASDNGCAPYAGNMPLGGSRTEDKLMEAKGHFPSADRRGYKSDAWDGGHRIPLIVRWPGTVQPGAQCRRLVCLNDWMATCADILDTQIPGNAGEDSVSLLPLLRGGDQAVRDTLVHHSINGYFAIRAGQWKLILCPGSGGWSPGSQAPPVQLYDTAQDLGEQKNLAAEHPEIVRRLTERLERIVADGRSTPGPRQKDDVSVDIFKSGK